MTYGQFLRHCYQLSGVATKKAFAERMGMKHPDHLIGAMNDRPDKKPSLDLLERAAKTVGVDFQDYILDPKKMKASKSKRSQENEKILQQVAELLDREEDEIQWLIGNIQVFHEHFTKGPRKRHYTKGR